MNNGHTYIHQLESALSATSIISPASFLWFGKTGTFISPIIRKKISDETIREHLIFSLQNILYNNFYCKGIATAPSKSYSSEISNNNNSFVHELSAVNCGAGYSEENWIVRKKEHNRLGIEKDGLTLWATPEQIGGNRLHIEPGESVSVCFSKELKNSHDGYYVALGNINLTPGDWDQMVRIYWNLTPLGAVLLMRKATMLLNAARLPFRLKILKDLDRFTRCDSGVLYIRKNDYPSLITLLNNLYGEVKDNVRKGIPVFSKPVSRGIGLAESPAGGASFGMHRCKLLAKAIITASDEQQRSLQDQLKVTIRIFNNEGINIYKPYLNAGSQDIYVEHLQPGKTIKTNALQSKERQGMFDPNAYLNIALEIGESICNKALWYNNRCTWMGQSLGDKLNPSTYISLGTDVYSGTMGIAFFLAQLYKETGIKQILKTILGAINQSQHKLSETAAGDILGLYHGGLGQLYFMARVGEILKRDNLKEAAQSTVKHCLNKYKSEKKWDLISGNAGSIIALLGLSRIFDESGYLDFAKAMGEELVAAATPFRDGFSWKTFNATNEHDLTGFSHGTGGIGYALLELYAATNNETYSQAARKAFNYEQYWFDANKKNWPDLRDCPSTIRKDKYVFPYCSYWCYGAPGIALSRLRAYQILKDVQYKDQALLALENVLEWTDSMLYSGTMNFSLCHGFGGNADVLKIGSQVLGDEFPIGIEIAEMVARMGIKQHSKPENPWICGTPSGSTPGLMLGLAGIGYFYLRMINPKLESPLLVGNYKMDQSMGFHNKKQVLTIK